jgi:flavin-dependent dehydrogenase
MMVARYETLSRFTLNRIPVQDEVLILGGGVAGCAASIALARKRRRVTLIEREPASRHKVCGEFLSGEALDDLHALGIDVASLGAVPIDYVRLAAARRAAQAPLPFPAASLTRKALDTALIAEAIAAGVRVERGRSVEVLGRTASNAWQATLDDGTTYEAPTVFLATGKHDLRGHLRPKDPQRWVAFKTYFRLAPAQAAELERTSELMLYPGGYGGIQPVEGGIANLCCVVAAEVSRACGSSMGELSREDAAGLSTPRDETCRCGALARQANRHYPYPLRLHPPHNREWALLHRRSGSRHPLVHR